MKKKKIKIYTDASYSNGSAGVGYSALHNKKITFGFNYVDDVRSSTNAELHGIFNAINVGLQFANIPIVVLCDCTGVVKTIYNVRRGNTSNALLNYKESRRLTYDIVDIIENHPIDIYWINRDTNKWSILTDKLAKKAYKLKGAYFKRMRIYDYDNIIRLVSNLNAI